MRQAQVQSGMIVGVFLFVAMTGTGRAEPGFDEKYQRDFNIFNPINQYQPGNPLNPINAYDPANPFDPINQFDPGNPPNPINQFNPSNRFSLADWWGNGAGPVACAGTVDRRIDSRFATLQLTLYGRYINLMPSI